MQVRFNLFLLLSLSIFLSASAHGQTCARSFGPLRACCQLRSLGGDQFTKVRPPKLELRKRAGATLNITSERFLGVTMPPEADTALQYAGQIWGSLLCSDVPIKIAVVYFPLPSGSLGVALANAKKDFGGAPVSGTWYPSALADALSGTNQQPGEDDILIYLNSNANWYFGLDGNTPAGKTDFVSVALHEMGHGLGFTSLAKSAAGQGSFGLIKSTDFPPTTFPFPNLDTLPGVYDRFIYYATQDTHLVDFVNPSSALASAFQSNDLWLDGPFATAAGTLAKLYAPRPFDLGSSITHLDQSTYPAGDTNSLMTPFIGTAEAVHHPGPIVLGLLRDIGWDVCPPVAVEEELWYSPPVAFPNPFRDQLFLQTHLIQSGQLSWSLYDSKGALIGSQTQWVTSGKQQLSWKGKLPEVSGLFFYRIEIGDKYFSEKILIN